MSLWQTLLCLVLQARCGGCGTWQALPFCRACEAAWPDLPAARCSRCAVPVGDSPCAACSRSEPAFNGTVAIGAYAGVLREALHALKYQGRRAIAPYMGRRLSMSPDMPEGDWLVVPVPMPASRQRQRGFNQAALLGKALAKHRRWRYAEPLERVHDTAPQHSLSRAARRDNLAGAFRCRTSLRGRRILLVDDVLTTGATAHWSAQALLEAGAEEVFVAVVARTLPPGWNRDT